ncbi:hypothetical protein DFJ63DRAFT_314821 [Scheffersomyces coipomensis]|uniref:uncharacterized protein n=1 Tax=Scheffersomyces coipomensis TaxID=1788519 RepID=UPI00315C6D32
MDESDESTPFYIHSNGSSSSSTQVLQPNNISSQVSSVGFNNLKKLNTNSSSISTISSSTTKNNALTRLFTKNRSNTNLAPQPIEFSEADVTGHDSDDDLSTLTSLEIRRTPSSLFKLPKNKLKFATKPNLNKPDLTIQTAGHHGLKVSKKILSSGSFDDAPKSLRKASVTSPASTFHNLFHRSNQGFIDGQITSSSKEESPTQSKLNINPSRTTISLSSNRSNSYVSDKNFAKIYNFTDPDFSAESSDSATEHSSFHDIHKKLMLPTDQFISNMTHKHNAQEMGLGIVTDFDYKNESYNKYILEFSKTNAKFFNSLLNLSKPLFTPTQQKKLSNGSTYSNLGFSVEDISNFIKDNYHSDMSQENQSTKYANRKKQSKIPKSNSSTSFSLDIDVAEPFDEFAIREISSDLLTFFTKAMIIFQRDSVNYDFPGDILKSEIVPAKSEATKSLIKSWLRICQQWDFFNQRIRYHLISIFHPLQISFRELSTQRLTTETTNIEIENSLLLAFRDVIVVPFLIHRKRQHEEFNSNEINFVKGEENKIIKEEISILLKNTRLLRKLKSCLGILMSNTHYETGNVDGEQHIRNEVFFNAYVWLSSLN